MRDEHDAERIVDLRVMCTLTPAAMATRKAALLPGLVRRAESREDLPNGVRFRFGADAWPAIAETIEAERHCCRFLRFEITVEPDGGSIWVTLSGPSGTREFLTALIDT
jgi:hypothetical protein